MTSTKPKKATKQSLKDLFESLPVSAYRGFRNDGVEPFLRHVFGPDTTVEPVIHCAEHGTWIDYLTVLVLRPQGGGAHGFVLKDGDHEWCWQSRDRWSRLRILSDSLDAGVWSAPDLPALVAKMARKVAKTAEWSHPINFDTSGALNGESSTWMLRHALRRLPAADTAATEFLLALTHDASAHTHLRRMVDAADNVADNWQATEESAQTTIEAVRRYNGVTLSGAQVEHLRVSGALMTYPRQDWDTEADRLVRTAYERLSLGSSFHPAPPSPAAATRSSRGSRMPFPFAV